MPCVLPIYTGNIDGHQLFGGTNIIGRFIPADVNGWKVVDDCLSDLQLIVYDIGSGLSERYQHNVPV